MADTLTYDEVMNLGGGDRDAARGLYQIRRLDRQTGEVTESTRSADRVNAEWEVTSGTSAAPD